MSYLVFKVKSELRVLLCLALHQIVKLLGNFGKSHCIVLFCIPRYVHLIRLPSKLLSIVKVVVVAAPEYYFSPSIVAVIVDLSEQ